MKLTKEEFESLYSSDISKREYDRIIGLVDERFTEVVFLIQPHITDGHGWFAYSNVDYYSEIDEGHFDLDKYREEIDIGGECRFPEPYCFCNDGNGYIPTRWLWTDDDKILEEFNKEVKKAEQKKLEKKKTANQKRLEFKARRKMFQQIIKYKLTEEELKHVDFK